MKKLPSFVSSRLAERQTKSSEHPDADMLGAFIQGNVSRQERDAVLGHCADCPDCREVLSRIQAPDPVPATTRPEIINRAGWWGWRLAASMAIMLFVAAIFWRLYSPPRPPAPITPPAPQAPAPTAPPLEPAPVLSIAIPPEKKRVRASVMRSKQAAPEGRAAEAISPAAPVTKPLDVYRAGQEMIFSSRRNAGFIKPSLPQTSARGEIASTWSLDPEPAEGTVKKSDDGGKTWRTIPIDGVTPFYALSANGANIWVGGAHGKLYHSIDAGIQWTPVTVTDQDTPLRESVVGIETRNGTIRVKTASGLTLESIDGGEHWKHAQ